MTKRTRKELEVASSSFYSLTANDGDYYLKDNEGNIYCWHTASDKMFDWMMYSNDEKRTCSFTVGHNWKHPNHGTVTHISNVRF